MKELYIIYPVVFISMGFIFFCIISYNPIYSLINMIGLVLIIGFTSIFLGLDYMAFMILIIYVGAIAVLFLFIIMMINFRQEYIMNSLYRYMGISVLLLINIYYFIQFSNQIEIFNNIEKNPKFVYIDWEAKITDFHNIDAINILLYDKYGEVFLLLGILLFVIMIGVIFLTINLTDPILKKQDIKNNDLKNYLKIRKYF